MEVTVYFVGSRTWMPLSCHWWAILHHPLPVHCLWYRRRVGWLGRRLLLRSLSEYQLSAEESECSGDLVQLRVHLLCLEQHYIWVSIALYPVLLIPNKVICSLLFAWWTELFSDKSFLISNQNLLCWDAKINVLIGTYSQVSLAPDANLRKSLVSFFTWCLQSKGIGTFRIEHSTCCSYNYTRCWGV